MRQLHQKSASIKGVRVKYIEKIQYSAAYIQENLGKIQDGTIALVTGTGLGGLTDTIENKKTLSYSDIPEFPVSIFIQMHQS